MHLPFTSSKRYIHVPQYLKVLLYHFLDRVQFLLIIFHVSITYSAYPQRAAGWLVPIFSSHWVRGGVHLEQVPSPSQGDYLFL